MRFCISVVKPDITLLTTIIVATPSVTLMIDAKCDIASAQITPGEEQLVHFHRSFDVFSTYGPTNRTSNTSQRHPTAVAVTA